MKRRIFSVALAIMIACSFSGCAGITVVKKGEELNDENGNDIAAIWDEQVVPEIKENAVELSDLLETENDNMESSGEKYGRYSNGSSGNLNFAVHVTGTVEDVNVDKKAGYLIVKQDGYDGTVCIMVQIGSVFKGTSLRDYLSFINVNDYKDQIEYAQLAKDLNAYVGENVVDYEEASNAKGKKIDIYGCFTYEKNDELLILPVELSLS